jgi:hypothetical protein
MKIERPSSGSGFGACHAAQKLSGVPQIQRRVTFNYLPSPAGNKSHFLTQKGVHSSYCAELNEW